MPCAQSPRAAMTMLVVQRPGAKDCQSAFWNRRVDSTLSRYSIRSDGIACSAGEQAVGLDRGPKEGSQRRWREQPVATPARSETQELQQSALIKAARPATERDWGTQTGAPRASRTRQKPTRLAAPTVSSPAAGDRLEGQRAIARRRLALVRSSA